MIQDEQTQTLMGFGLTFLQAKTYLALAKLGKADVKTVARASSVARQDIYRIMPTLQKLGLAEKIVAKPIMYKATPITEGLSILLQNRKKEYNELQKKTTSLINNFHAENAKIVLTEEETQFIITSEITRFLKIHRNQARKAKKSIDIIIPVISLPFKVKDEWANLKQPLKRGVKVRLITIEPKDEITPTPWQALVKSPLFEIKYLAAPLHFGMHIFDKKVVTLQVSEKNMLPSLFSTNPNVVKLASSYFNKMWSKPQRNQLTNNQLNLTETIKSLNEKVS